MKSIGILYICTGKYDVFWKDFYLSVEKNFMPEYKKNYYVFTDSQEIYDSDKNKRIHVIYQQQLPWPLATLLRFHIFNMHKKLYKDDYLFFMNANLEIVEEIHKNILDSSKNMFFVQHPGYYNVKRKKFEYENNKKSTAFISRKEGKYYVAGGMIGGKTKSFLKMSSELEENINRDFKQNIIARWHDESHINRYIIGRSDVQILSPEYLYPEDNYEWLKDLKPKIIIRDKKNYGGHNFLRSNND